MLLNYTKSRFGLAKWLSEYALRQPLPDEQWLIDDEIWYNNKR
jgi:hypothetical protein